MAGAFARVGDQTSGHGPYPPNTLGGPGSSDVLIEGVPAALVGDGTVTPCIAPNSKDLDGGPWQVIEKDGHSLIVKDVIADAFLQQILLRPSEYDVIATLNLNGDYISDALAAIVGGIGIAPGANINYKSGHAIFEATHGTAPKYAGKDQVNPSSVILSGVMMLEYLGWKEAGDLIIKGIEGAINKKRVTYDFHRLMENATKLKCSEFGDEIIAHM